MRTRRALLLSDVHIGWTVCARGHLRLLERLHEAADDAELIVLNGDIVDHHRGLPRPIDTELVAMLTELLHRFRAEGRKVVYVEGNHDEPASDLPLAPDRWLFDWEGAHGERVRVLHGHRFSDEVFQQGPYERYGRHLIRAENWLYARIAPMRMSYRMGPGWLVGAVGRTEDILWTRDFPGRVSPLLGDTDVLVHGHFHFGRAHRTIAGKPVWRTGAWVSRGHLGSKDRMLRYTDGRFERIELTPRGFRPTEDGL
ncbi:MAG: metallophosphoesterase [Polyangiaceae bacterium]